MSRFANVVNLLKNDRRNFFAILLRKYGFFLPDKLYLYLQFYIGVGKKLNLKNPKTFNEKLQWLKLYDRNPLYSVLVDKYAVKKWVADRIGSQYLIPTIGVWNQFEEIDIDKLPNQFVLKCTHDSGGLIIVKNKCDFDVPSAKKKIETCLKRKYYYSSREWPYKNVLPKIIAEPYMEDEYGKLNDYKFFCFDGKVKALFIASDRQSDVDETKFDFFDRNFNHLPFTKGHPNAKNVPKKPQMFDKMLELAEKLSQGIPHVRVDFYEIGMNVYFGEMTFFSGGGFVPFEPEEWDFTFGSWIDLCPKMLKNKK